MPVRYREQAHFYREMRRPEASGRLEGGIVVAVELDLIAPWEVCGATVLVSVRKSF